MEQPIPNQIEDESIRVLEAQIRELYGRICYTHKTHEKAAEASYKLGAFLKFIQIGLSAAVTVGAFTAIFEKNWAAIVTTIASAILTGVSAYLKNTDPASVAQRHRSTAAELWTVREAYFSLLSDIVAGLITTNDIQQRRDELHERLGAIYKTAPATDSAAYTAAKKGLKRNEELTFSDSEIDAFLPEIIRVSSRNLKRAIDSAHRDQGK
ncbi:SLATT domain-containing protein [Magnetospirillum fulvum]|uniref:SLATT domain-containing protein n=1 Tax=Magnetospirillum fulvum TaxID=1082 RepID=UPI0012DC43CA|nr:SLATT domain-containing protein [Magnetospirillum fulvum]